LLSKLSDRPNLDCECFWATIGRAPQQLRPRSSFLTLRDRVRECLIADGLHPAEGFLGLLVNLLLTAWLSPGALCPRHAKPPA